MEFNNIIETYAMYHHTRYYETTAMKTELIHTITNTFSGQYVSNHNPDVKNMVDLGLDSQCEVDAQHGN